MRRFASVVLAFSMLVWVLPARADSQTTRARPQRQYDAGWLHRMLLGDLNRELWALEVEVPLLDLRTYASGLTPLERGGGLQTSSLRLMGADGQRYTFRSIDKDVTLSLDPLLSASIFASVRQDYIGALFPLSAMVVAPLLEAADVLHADPELVVMPSDPSLGEFLEDFGGLLGWIEVRPDEGPDGTPGFAGSSRVVNSDTFRDRLESNPENKVDATGYLRARLMDLFVGDWDRHPDQWRWAAFEEGDSIRWEPIPRDRDWALSNIDGLVYGLARPLLPHYLGFSDKYQSVFGATWSGRALDRQLLSELERADWEETASDLRRRLSDQVIQSAVRALPESYQSAVGDELRRALVSRRDRLYDAAMEFYGILSGWVDVLATDQDEIARFDRSADGAVTLSISENGPDAAAYFVRRFDPADTKEIRLFMRGGRDIVRVQGSGPAEIKLRLIGGGNDDTFEILSADGVFIYDDRGDNNFTAASAVSIDESDYEEPDDTEAASHQARPRDWGSRWYNFPLGGANTDIGLFLGVIAQRDTYGFRHHPYKNRLTLSAAFNPVVLGMSGQLKYDFSIRRAGLRGILDIEGSTREVRRYFGTGNRTESSDEDEFFRADRAFIGVNLGIEPSLPEGWSFSVAPVFRFSTPVDEEVTFIEAERPRPYGFDDFSQAGLVGGLTWDSRDEPALPSRGGLLELEGRYYPSILDVDEPYGGIRGSASINIKLGRPVLSLKARAEKVWGAYPYFDGARLGGASSLRGFSSDRFVGDASILTSAQLRLPVTDFFVLIPGTLGIHGLVDAGRVYLEGETTDKWHVAPGGGLWISVFEPKYTLGLTVAQSDDGTGFYLSLGSGY